MGLNECPSVGGGWWFTDASPLRAAFVTPLRATSTPKGLHITAKGCRALARLPWYHWQPSGKQTEHSATPQAHQQRLQPAPPRIRSAHTPRSHFAFFSHRETDPVARLCRPTSPHTPPKYQRTFSSSPHHTSIKPNPLPIPLPKTNAPIRPQPDHPPSPRCILDTSLCAFERPPSDRFKHPDL